MLVFSSCIIRVELPLEPVAPRQSIVVPGDKDTVRYFVGCVSSRNCDVGAVSMDSTLSPVLLNCIMWKLDAQATAT